MATGTTETAGPATDTAVGSRGLLPHALRELWHAASDPILLLDDSAHCAYTNPAFVTTFGQPPSGRRRLPMLTPESEVLVLRRLARAEAASNGAAVHLHLNLVTPRGAGVVPAWLVDLGVIGAVLQFHVVHETDANLDADLRLERLERLLARALEASARPLDRTDDVPAAERLALEADLDELTARELEVVGLLRLGHRVSTIARLLVISPHTVRNHLKSIFRKLSVSSQAELVARLNGMG